MAKERSKFDARRGIESIAGVVHEASGQWSDCTGAVAGALDESGLTRAGRNGRASCGFGDRRGRAATRRFCPMS